MLDPAVTVKTSPLDATPLTVTITSPVVAPDGTTATIDVALQLETAATAPLKVTALVPCDAPKFVPAMVTDVPTGPNVGDKLLIPSVPGTVNGTPLDATPLTVTTTLPVVAPDGTSVAIDVALQLETVATVPLKVTILVSCDVPKFVPVIVTEVPTAPEAGDKLLIVGPRTVKGTPLDATPLAVTTTMPVVAPDGATVAIDVALQFKTVAAVPLKVTVLVPCDAPKFIPVIVTEAPTFPKVGERLVITGVGSTVKATPLDATPPTVTTTLPVVAPDGTTVTIDVALQPVIVAGVPLKVTVPVVPNCTPVMVTEAPTAPEAGDRLVIVGPRTVNNTPLLN